MSAIISTLSGISTFVSSAQFINACSPIAVIESDRATNYHLYAKWIQFGTVEKDATDTNIISGYRGFDLASVQIRPKTMKIKDETTASMSTRISMIRMFVTGSRALPTMSIIITLRKLLRACDL